jgi:hypothetical protein
VTLADAAVQDFITNHQTRFQFSVGLFTNKLPFTETQTYSVVQVLKLAILHVESISCTTSKTFTVSVRVQAVCVATFSSLRTVHDAL